jgi:S-formylglutathione hydrolase
MYAHGYRGTGPALTVAPPRIRRHLVANGYAWAASSYSANHYDVRAGVEDTNALALAFTRIARENGRALAEPTHRFVTGHSMGGHGALTIAMSNPAWIRSVSAFAPIGAPMRCPWGEKAFTGYLGDDRAAWAAYDTTELIRTRGWAGPSVLVDQGEADPFLEAQLKPELLERACADAKLPLELRRQPGYDHGYFFVSSFIEDHLRLHRARI